MDSEMMAVGHMEVRRKTGAVKGRADQRRLVSVTPGLALRSEESAS